MPSVPQRDNAETWIVIMEKFRRSVSFLAWGYNEELLVEAFVDRAIALLESVVEEFEIVFVDDGSTDRTGAIVDARAARDPRVKVVRLERNQGVGVALRTAVRSASNEFLFWQTVDWAYDIRQLRIFLELTTHFDVVQGVRPVPERLFSRIPLVRSVYRVKGRSDTFAKAFVSLANYYALRLLFGVPFNDYQNVTLYPTALVQGIEHTARSSFANPEYLLKAYASGARFIEVPINFIPRVAGRAKGTRWRSIAASLGDIAGQWLAWGRNLRREHPFTPDRIKRVADPFKLDEPVLRLVLPLFKDIP
jgi:glycosyltransferase involved in cell wall biosynthesis